MGVASRLEIRRRKFQNLAANGAELCFKGLSALTKGFVAESMGYAMALSLDATFVIAALALIPFLKNREENPDMTGMEPVPTIDQILPPIDL